MPLIRYRSPDDPAFAVSGRSRFRVDHGIFDLPAPAIRDRIARVLDERRGWDLRAMKLVEEDRRLRACLEWLDTLPEGDDVFVPELKHEPAIDLVADRLIGDGEFARVGCPACEATYSPGEVAVEPWSFEDEGMTVHGRRTACPRGHVVHALRDSIDAPGIERDD